MKTKLGILATLLTLGALRHKESRTMKTTLAILILIFCQALSALAQTRVNGLEARKAHDLSIEAQRHTAEVTSLTKSVPKLEKRIAAEKNPKLKAQLQKNFANSKRQLAAATAAQTNSQQRVKSWTTETLAIHKAAPHSTIDWEKRTIIRPK